MISTGDPIFSHNTAIDMAIRKMLPSFSEESQRRIRKAVINARKASENHRDENTDAGARHIFRELIPACMLNQYGFALEYEKTMQGKTPDWLDCRAKLMLESYTYERGGSSSFFDRVSASIASKCNKYEDIVSTNSLNFAMAVYLDFLTAMTLDECREDSEMFRAVFDTNDSLGAILFFTETCIVRNKQCYGFLCLCRDSFVTALPGWPLEPELTYNFCV